MNRKYFPWLALLGALLLFFWVKKNQRGVITGTRDRIEVQAPVGNGDGFDRNIRPLVYSTHARCRMDCRHIDESEVEEILANGRLNISKIETSGKGVSYPVEGRTHDGQRVRIVFAPKKDKMVVVTVIDLEVEYKCECR